MNISHTLHNVGIQVDLLGQPLVAGDVVLVKGFNSFLADTITTVKRVNKKSITVELPCTYTEWGILVPPPDNDIYRANWDYYPDMKVITSMRTIRRRGYDVVKLPPDYAEKAETAKQAAISMYPEVFI